jgi:hypothetical protein
VPAPPLNSVAQRLYDQLAPLQYDEANQNYALAKFCAAVGGMLQIIEDYARDQADANGNILPGWSQLLDLNRAPFAALPWLGQFVGVPVTRSLTDAQQRAQIRAVGGWNRGTVAAMVAALQPTLTGTKTVIVKEQDPVACPSIPAYGITFTTYLAETPNIPASLAALVSQKPAGLILNFVQLLGEDYATLLANHALYSNVFSDFLTYQGIATNTPGT